VLHEFLTTNTLEIISRARANVTARTSPAPTADELKNGVPLFLSQLGDRLRRATTDNVAIGDSAALHGGELLTMGFSVGQVVQGYGDVCQVITQLAEETNAPITVDEFNVLNRCLDDAIAHSVTEYERQRDAAIAYQGTERLGMLAHELRNRVSAALVSYSILQKGTVGIGGSTGAVLGRSLRALRDLVNNSLSGVRLEAGLTERQRVSLVDLIADAGVEASMAADLGGFELAVAPVAAGIHVDVDPQILSAVIGNLLQNAFKFSRPHGHVALRTFATPDRALIEVEDECGGLPPGEGKDLFRSFTQLGSDRSGLGLGLSISRKGVEAMGGKIDVRNLPGKGCVFSIDLPRLPAA
jgi:signal transduction histidine kinase